ncbi:taste receptor type 2 member 41-like [Ranitomeya variabilis]|uniref:taste receptor type 2 member 41-like n=1 Tax=Ranitomeya variabilis TaxID=490064 RepID=UPI0040571EED
MSKAWNYFCVLTDFVSLLIVPGYLFILVVNFLEWIKTKRLKISDQLSSGLSILCCIHRFLQLSVHYIMFIDKVQITFYLLLTTFLHLSLVFCTLLFSMWLAVHFCLKIVNINQKLYLYIQRRFPKLFPWILLPSVLVSLLISGPAAQNMAQQHLHFTNISLNDLPLKSLPFFRLYFGASYICFFVFLIAIMFLLFSLCGHIRLRAGTIKAHMIAVKTLASLLFANVIYFILVLLSVENLGGEIVIRILLFSYTVLHVLSLPILIYMNSILRNKFWSIWSKLRCFKRSTQVQPK